MKKVLFAFNGLQPGKALFRYAVQFCRKMKADLLILQIVPPGFCHGAAKTLKDTLVRAQNRIDDTLVSASLAEAGAADAARDCLQVGRERIERLLPRTDADVLRRSFEQKVGDPDQEIYAYVRNHPDIVLTIYDALPRQNQTGTGSGRRGLWEKIPSELGIPFVMSPDSKISKGKIS